MWPDGHIRLSIPLLPQRAINYVWGFKFLNVSSVCGTYKLQVLNTRLHPIASTTADPPKVAPRGSRWFQDGFKITSNHPKAAPKIYTTISTCSPLSPDDDRGFLHTPLIFLFFYTKHICLLQHVHRSRLMTIAVLLYFYIDMPEQLCTISGHCANLFKCAHTAACQCVNMLFSV